MAHIVEARLSPQQTIALSATEHDDDGAAAAVAEMRLWVERHVQRSAAP